MPGRSDVLCMLPLGTPPCIVQLPAGPGCSARVTSVPVPVAYGRMTPALSEAVANLAGLVPPSKRPAAAVDPAVLPPDQRAVQWASAPSAPAQSIAQQVAHVRPTFSAFPDDSKLRRLPVTDMHVCSAIEWAEPNARDQSGSAALYVGTNSGYVHRLIVTPPVPATHPLPQSTAGGCKRPREECRDESPGAISIELSACTRLPSLSSVSALNWSPQQGGLLLAQAGEANVDLLDPESLELRDSMPEFDRPTQAVRGCPLVLRRGMVQLHREQPLVVAANSSTRYGYVFAGYDTRTAGSVQSDTVKASTPRLAVCSQPDEVGISCIEWHPHAPVLLVSNSSDTIHAWVLATDADWSAFSPYFPELGLNVEYIEREDEFDGVTEEQAAAAVASAGSGAAEDDFAAYGLTAKAAAAAFHVAPAVAQRIAAGQVPHGLASSAVPLPAPAADATAATTQQSTYTSVDDNTNAASFPVDVIGGLRCAGSAAAAALQAAPPALTQFRSNPDESFVSTTVPLFMAGADGVGTSDAASAAHPTPDSSAERSTHAAPSAAEAWQRAGGSAPALWASMRAALQQEGWAQMTAVGRARLGNAALYDASGGYFQAAPSAAAQQQ